MAAVTAAAAGAVLIGGCAAPSSPDPPARSDWRYRDPHRDTREREMQQTWIGRTRQELIDRFGPPSTVMGIPGYRQPNAVILVYWDLDTTGGCSDAFVVLTDPSEQIWYYHCR